LDLGLFQVGVMIFGLGVGLGFIQENDLGVGLGVGLGFGLDFIQENDLGLCLVVVFFFLLKKFSTI
jgi:hypothetical protein